MIEPCHLRFDDDAQGKRMMLKPGEWATRSFAFQKSYAGGRTKYIKHIVMRPDGTPGEVGERGLRAWLRRHYPNRPLRWSASFMKSGKCIFEVYVDGLGPLPPEIKAQVRELLDKMQRELEHSFLYGTSRSTETPVGLLNPQREISVGYVVRTDVP